MRLAGTWSRYSKSAMPQLASAASHHARCERFRRCAYQANVMKMFESTSRPAVCRKTDVFTLTSPGRLNVAPRIGRELRAGIHVAGRARAVSYTHLRAHETP